MGLDKELTTCVVTQRLRFISIVIQYLSCRACKRPRRQRYKRMPGKLGENTMKRPRTEVMTGDFFAGLFDDIVLIILCKLSLSATHPSDIGNIFITCKRLKDLAHDQLVFSNVSPKSLAINAKNWSESAHRFLKQCVDAGSPEARYTLGMIEFYCLQNRRTGASLIAKAAMRFHAVALFSLAVILFNGSGGSRKDKNLKAGVALCAKSAILGHLDALRELGYCLQDGYGVRQNIVMGRRLLVQANARELAAAFPSFACKPYQQVVGLVRPLLSDFGGDVPAPESHPANQFLKSWFESRMVGIAGPDGEYELRLCSYPRCGRPETRKHEFRRCYVCGDANYCSRVCQALHWKLAHKAECKPLA